MATAAAAAGGGGGGDAAAPARPQRRRSRVWPRLVFAAADALPVAGPAPPADAAAAAPGAGAADGEQRAAADVFAELTRREGFVLLDGGLATEIEERVTGPLDPVLWSAGALRTDPDAVVAAHAAYYAAGADVAITAGYQSSRMGWAKVGEGDAARADTYAAEAVRLAAKARAVELGRRGAGAGARPPPLVAASIGPYAACLADGSEYSPKYAADPRAAARLLRFHLPRVRAALRGGPGLLAFETIPCAADAAAFMRLLREERIGGREVPHCWVTFCCKDAEHLSSGEPLAEVVRLVLKHDARRRVLGVGVNCLAPQHAEAAVRAVAAAVRRAAAADPAAPRRYVVCYPNSGEEWDGAAKQWRQGTGLRHADAHFVDLSQRLRAAGAEVVGGCCRTTPATIAALRAGLRRAEAGAPPAAKKPRGGDP